MSRIDSPESDDSTGFPCRSGEFRSFDGTIIRFDVYDHPGPATVVVLPGFWRHRRYPSMKRLGIRLQESGYRCVIVDLRGHGESEGRFGFNRDEWRDVDALLKILRERFGTIRIDLLGMSAGGAIAVSTAARTSHRIEGVFLISPVASFKRVVPRINPFTIHRHIELGQAFAAPRFRWTRRDCIPAIEDVARVHVPLELVHVKNDWLVSHVHSELLYDAANEPKQLHILDIPGHWHADRIFGIAEETIEALLLPFLARTLKAAE